MTNWTGPSHYSPTWQKLMKSIHSEAQIDPEGRSDTHSPLMAVTTVVCTLVTTVCGPPSILSVQSRPTVTTGVCLK